jgi:hypothetical protein
MIYLLSELTSIPALENFLPVQGFGEYIPIIGSEEIFLWDSNSSSWLSSQIPQIALDASLATSFGSYVYLTDSQSYNAFFNVYTMEWFTQNYTDYYGNFSQ